jgi:hypothetical protein
MRRLLLAVCVCVLVPAAVAYGAAVSGTFKGKTSQGAKHGQVQIKVAKGDVVGKSSFFDYAAACKGGSVLTGSTAISGQLHKGNTFAVINAKYSSSVQGGFTANHTTTIKFAIKGNTASGTFSNSAVIVKGKKVITTCKTGKLTFKATK